MSNLSIQVEVAWTSKPLLGLSYIVKKKERKKEN
jgi:hypothetical protein